MEKHKLVDFFKNNKIIFFIICLSLVCWGGLLTLKGIWWDDWAWIGVYFESKNINEFILPFKSLRKEVEGYILYFLFSLFEIFRGTTPQIWSILKFIIFTVNALLLYFISKSILRNKTILPETIAITYLVSPIVNNLCTVTLIQHIELFSFFLSILFTIKSVKENNLKTLNYFLAILFAAFPMICLGSFVFFDALRLVIIFYILLKVHELKFSKALKRTFLFWLPFLLIGIAVLVDSKMRPQYGAYAGAYAMKPFSYTNMLIILKRYLQSLDYLASPYYITAIPFVRKLGMMNVTKAIPIFAFCFACVFAFKKDQVIKKENLNILREIRLVFLFGIFSIIVGLFPYAAVRGAVRFGLSSRHGILANVGLSIFIPSFLLMLYYKKVINKPLYYILFGSIIFAGVFQCRNAVAAYDNLWQEHRSFLLKFINRVPDLKDKTFIIVDMPQRSKYFADWRTYSLTVSLNLLYAKSRRKSEFNKHFVADTKNSWARLKYQSQPKVQDIDYKGKQQFYPRNLIIASYYNGEVYLNREINESNSRSTEYQTEPLTSFRLRPNQIINKKNTNQNFPFRWILKE